MAEILMIRHGQASFGTDDYDSLSELGLHQADLTGRYLADNEPGLSAVYSGQLLRQRQTAQAIADAHATTATIPIEVDRRFDELDTEHQISCLLPALVERDPALQQRVLNNDGSKRTFQKILREVFRYWVLEQPQVEGLESWSEFSQRVGAALDQLIKQQGSGRKTVISTSGGVIATLVQQVLAVPDNQVYSLFEAMLNCSITRLVYNGRGEVAVQSFNDVSFLRAQDESLITYR